MTANAAPRRPTWRRLAGLARSSGYRLATVVERVALARRAVLLPPAHLRIYYYRSWRHAVFARACQGARTELLLRGLRAEHRVLDIGSGIGILAIGLLDYLQGGYDGVEIHREAVEWCQEAITPRHPAFRFHRADVISSAYNPRGRIPAAAYRFPFPDESFEFIFLGSVFTHMLPDAVEHYVREIARLLSPEGVCVASCFLLNDRSRAAVESGGSFMSFGVEHASGVCRLHEATRPEAAVALDEAFVERIHAAAGLRIRDVRRGRWWSGAADDQDVLTVVRNTAGRPSGPPGA